MRSSLTRQIFRDIINGRSISHQSLLPQRRVCSTPVSFHVVRPQSRTLFGFGKPKKEPLDEHSAKLVLDRLTINLDRDLRPPPFEDIQEAFDFLQWTVFRRNGRLTLTQTYFAWKTYQWFETQQDPSKDPLLDFADLQMIISLLARQPFGHDIRLTVEYARKVWHDMLQRSEEYVPSEEGQSIWDEVLPKYLRILANGGHVSEAEKEMRKGLSQAISTDTKTKCWLLCVKAYLQSNQQQEALKSLKEMRKAGHRLAPDSHEELLRIAADKQDFETTKEWYCLEIDDGKLPTARAMRVMLQSCLHAGELAWGEPILKQLLEASASKWDMDISLQWAAAQGKSVEDLERMIDAFNGRLADKSDGIDANTVNSLIELAYQQKQDYKAERYLMLAERRKVPLNASTHLIQLDHRLAQDDIGGAVESFTNLQKFEFDVKRSAPTTLKLLSALVTQPNPDHQRVHECTKLLVVNKVQLSVEAFMDLALYYIHKKELELATELLIAYTMDFSRQDRAYIMKRYMSYATDLNTETQEAWDVYTLFIAAFMETSLKDRHALMNSFFARGQPDMGMHIILSMRESILEEIHPTMDVYIDCIIGLTKHYKLASVRIVQNWIKLDVNVDPNTRMRNAVMLAYEHCARSVQALMYWDEIVNTREGPSYNSIRIALRACADAPFGEDKAMEIWQQLERNQVELDRDIYLELVYAVSWRGAIDRGQKLLEEMKAATGEEPDAYALGLFYNSLPGEERKSTAETWASSKYPEAWAELVQKGKQTIERGLRDEEHFQIGELPELSP